MAVAISTPLPRTKPQQIQDKFKIKAVPTALQASAMPGIVASDTISAGVQAAKQGINSAIGATTGYQFPMTAAPAPFQKTKETASAIGEGLAATGRGVAGVMGLEAIPTQAPPVVVRNLETATPTATPTAIDAPLAATTPQTPATTPTATPAAPGGWSARASGNAVALRDAQGNVSMMNRDAAVQQLGSEQALAAALGESFQPLAGGTPQTTAQSAPVVAQRPAAPVAPIGIDAQLGKGYAGYTRQEPGGVASKRFAEPLSTEYSLADKERDQGILPAYQDELGKYIAMGANLSTASGLANNSLNEMSSNSARSRKRQGDTADAQYKQGLLDKATADMAIDAPLKAAQADLYAAQAENARQKGPATAKQDEWKLGEVNDGVDEAGMPVKKSVFYRTGQDGKIEYQDPTQKKTKTLDDTAIQDYLKRTKGNIDEAIKLAQSEGYA